ncbi:hypothetical protein PC129_g17798 [Phytophthora cactorum]|uniref:Uncharacterized protein n=1 Tax=Phytophthora cactorum TaxID=29920 RepID=A0A8T1C234_9STRA|nr:hypothetical protein PC112_g18126 [Phytophthora cactorum]KAG2807150.1 hypothetical protein PC111_g17046 [Phytophthora cactorum]KAG2883471.1 hypothetical protein PC114_g20582 [Phytophthora cactorum]KAG2910987.1 hypothetical protein PC117_g19253 [Phytophthora cactorum]KAG2990001.1 hypothetical protein PC119_g19178 [Phytophthora cactorum]
METMAVNAVGRDMLLHASLLRALWGWIVQVDMREVLSTLSGARPFNTETLMVS